MSEWPDFGEHTVVHDGVELTCRYVVPGLTFHDLAMIFEAAKNNPENSSVAGNPSKWPDNAGLIAVIDAMFEALVASPKSTLLKK